MNNDKRRRPRLNHMKISIVTPVYNDPRIGRALQSTWDQRHDHELETIVIDGGSSDETLDVIEKYKDSIDILISEPDRGLYDGMNRGIKCATGDVIGILNADDYYIGTNGIRDVIENFERHPEIDACYGDIIYVDKTGEISRYWKSSRHRRLKWYWGWRPPHPSFFVRGEVYKRYGTFNLDFPIAGDYELQLRLLFKNNIPVLYLRGLLVCMTLGGVSNNSIRNIFQANCESFRAWQHNQLEGGYMVPLLKPLRNIIQLYLRPKRKSVEHILYRFVDLESRNGSLDDSEL